MAADLNRAHVLHSQLRCCSIERLCDALSEIRDLPQSDNSDGEEETAPISHFDKKPVAKRMRTFIPSFMDTKLQESVHAGHIQV